MEVMMLILCLLLCLMLSWLAIIILVSNLRQFALQLAIALTLLATEMAVLFAAGVPFVLALVLTPTILWCAVILRRWAHLRYDLALMRRRVLRELRQLPRLPCAAGCGSDVNDFIIYTVRGRAYCSGRCIPSDLRGEISRQTRLDYFHGISPSTEPGRDRATTSTAHVGSTR